MFTRKVLATVTALSLAVGSLGLASAIPAEAGMKKPVVHACTKHWVRLSKDNWIWTCGHHKVHKGHAMTTKVRKPYLVSDVLVRGTAPRTRATASRRTSARRLRWRTTGRLT